MIPDIKPYNREAYEKLKASFTHNKRACVTHCTGSGKSYISIQLIADVILENKKVLFVTISKTLIEQFRNKQVAKLEEHFLKTGNFSGYDLLQQNLTIVHYFELKDRNRFKGFDYIILDEFQRAGAEKTSDYVKDLFENNENAYFFGATATAIRGKERDMAKELFYGNVVSNITLYDAIVHKKIIPEPEYIACIYDIDDEIRKFLELLKIKRYSSVYEVHSKLIDKARKSLEHGHTDGLANIFQNRIRYPDGKYLVFCNSVSHMEKIIKQCEENWFTWTETPVQIFYQHCKDNPPDRNFKKFCEKKGKGLKLFFSINMFTTGVHIEDVVGVINFRSTKVIPLYLQIIGRALTCIDTNIIEEYGIVPQIFDIVDSLETMRRRLPYKIVHKHQKSELIPQIKDIRIADISIEPANQSSLQILSDLQEVINNQISWDDAYKIATEFYKEFGHLNVPRGTILNNFDLYSWVNYQRYLHNHSPENGDPEGKAYDREKTAKMERIGMDWDYDPIWIRFVEDCQKITVINGVRTITSSTCPTHSTLPNRLRNVRRAYRQGLLSEDKIRQLEKLHIVLDPRNDKFIYNKHYSKIKQFYNLNKHLRFPSTGEFAAAYRWLTKIIEEYNKPNCTLSAKEIVLLKELGIIKGVSYDFLKKYQEYTNALCETNKKQAKRWLDRQKEKAKKNELSNIEIQLLPNIKLR